MPPVHCTADNCNRRLTRGDKAPDANGDFICYKCYQRERRQSKEVRELEDKVAAAVLEAERKTAAAAQKESDLDAELKKEAQKRYQLEAAIMSRSMKQGGYKLEGKDAVLVADGIAAHDLEAAKCEAAKLRDQQARTCTRLCLRSCVCVHPPPLKSTLPI